MNYIKELNAFKNWLFLNEIPTSAIALWHTLMTINNATHWKREFNAPNSVVSKLSGLSKQGVHNARNHLIKQGRILCKKGKKGQAPIYQMVPFGGAVDSSVCPSMFQATPRSAGDTAPNDPARPPHASRAQSAANPDVTFDQVSAPSQRDASLDASLDASFDSSLDPSSDPSYDQFATESLTIHKQKHKQKKKQDSSSVHAFGDLVFLYENNIGKLPPLAADLLAAWCLERGKELVMAAIELAVKRGGRTFGYVESILKQWARADIMTLDEMDAFEQAKRARTSNAVSLPEGRNKEERAAFFQALRQEGALS